MPEVADGEQQYAEDCKLEHIAHYAHHNEMRARAAAMKHYAVTVRTGEVEHDADRDGLAYCIIVIEAWHVSAEKQECQGGNDDVSD